MERASLSTFKIAVLSSGNSRGSNLAAMAKYFAENRSSVSIAAAVFTVKNSPAIDVANMLGLHVEIISAKNMSYFETQLIRICEQQSISLIALAGFMKLLSEQFISSVAVPILNIHPALLPKYGGAGMYGMAVHEAVWKAGGQFSGATVHLVDSSYDTGKILAQKTVDVSECTSATEIGKRVLQAEHALYAPTIVNYLCSSPK
ncbi:MAG: formyltransferase family protein [Candidatus Cloacimonetes bacterium]|nr:formyltransferase family protein [Candidatus Cloacimonadota bacterium]